MLVLCKEGCHVAWLRTEIKLLGSQVFHCHAVAFLLSHAEPKRLQVNISIRGAVESGFIGALRPVQDYPDFHSQLHSTHARTP